MRDATGGRRGLADLFRRLWRSFGRAGRGITAADVRAAAAAVAGRSLARYFSRYIDGVEELPVPTALRRAGIVITRHAPWVGEEDATRARRQRGWAGLTFITSGDRATVRNVVPGSPAWRAGLTYGDETIAIGGQRVTASTVGRRLADRQPGEAVRIWYFRQEMLRVARLVLALSPERACEFSLDGAASSRARAVRRGWLGV